MTLVVSEPAATEEPVAASGPVTAVGHTGCADVMAPWESAGSFRRIVTLMTRSRRAPAKRIIPAVRMATDLRLSERRLLGGPGVEFMRVPASTSPIVPRDGSTQITKSARRRFS